MSIAPSKPDTMTFAKDGALRIRAALNASDLRGLEDAVANLPPDQAGIRLYGIPALRPWTVKSGLLHVAPPFDLLAGMVTLRVHLDPVPETNAPLLIAPGSHRLGQIPENEVKSVVQRCGAATCLADAGDVWLYSTPILHCSEAARDPAHRRVLQIDFVAGDLPGGLTWLGV